MERIFDVAIIGGGINGCGIAADAALRGLSVILLEKNDLAAHTSSSSSKLIHGGLRYLEYYDFSLVKKALVERQHLLHLAPHLVRPLSFVLPYQQHLRPAWMLRAGLLLYDNLSFKNKLPRSKFIRRNKQPLYFYPLKEKLNKGFLFYDCVTDDARLTISNALQAKEHGAIIQRNSSVEGAQVNNNIWNLDVRIANKKILVKAKTIINATGPWVESVNNLLNIPSTYKLNLVKGSHLVVSKLYEGEHAYFLQYDDKRVIFIVPYHGFTMIGTTEIAFNSPNEKISISAEEIDYLLTIANSYFNVQLQEKDIIDSWSGIRPLLADNRKEEFKALSRDYSYSYTNTPGPAVTIYGGKITTYRQLALEVINSLSPIFPHLKSSQTEKIPLPGAILAQVNYQEYVVYARKKYYWLTERIKERYLNNYGTKTEVLLAGCESLADLGQYFGPDLYEVEVNYLQQEEWAQDCEDILWRRTKLGLHFSELEKEQLNNYLLNSQT